MRPVSPAEERRGSDWCGLDVFTKELLIVNLTNYLHVHVCNISVTRTHASPAALISQELSHHACPGSRRSSLSRRNRLHSMTKVKRARIPRLEVGLQIGRVLRFPHLHYSLRVSQVAFIFKAT